MDKKGGGLLWRVERWISLLSKVGYIGAEGFGLRCRVSFGDDCISKVGKRLWMVLQIWSRLVCRVEDDLREF